MLASTLRNNNVNLAAGEIETGNRKLLVRAVGEYDSPSEVRKQPIGGGLRLGDVADVTYRFPDQWEYNFLNGVEALTVAIRKDSTANLLDVTERVRAELQAIQAMEEAEGLEIRIFSDASDDVKQGLGQLRQTGLVGGLLAIAAVFLFLRRFRTTLLIALAMPVSVVATFVLLYFLREGGLSDVTINVISLAGLMLALGMLVDNSVVVIESIFRHRNELGRDAKGAAIAGASEVALPITASTITTMCVFLPMIFLSEGGRFSLYFENVGVTICIVIVSSLLVALTIVPMAASLLLRGQAPRSSRFSAGLLGAYRRVLRWTLHHRLAFLLVVAGMLWGSYDMMMSIERAFSSRSLDRQVTVRVDTPRQYSFEQTRDLFADLYQRIDAQRDSLDIKDITYSFNRGTGRSGGGWSRSRSMNIYLLDEEESRLSTIDARERLRELLPVRAGVNVRIESSRSYGRSGGLEIELTGEDASVLELIAGQVVDALENVPALRDVGTSLESGNDEIRVSVRQEQALQAGLSSDAVARTISSALSSRALSYFRTDEREVDIIMQYPEESRETLGQLKNVPVFATEARLPLGAVAAFERTAGPRSIERVNHQQTIEIEANVTDPKAMFRAMGAATGVLNSMSMPPGYSWSFGRWNRFAQKDQDTGTFALLLALPLVYMVLAALFESFAQPFTIMFSVPFAMIGVGVVMKTFGQPWDNMTMIGLIVLVGVVVNNAIVLLDHINALRRSGLPREEAILQGGAHRLRPILITAVTTILGMMPMVAPVMFPQWFGPLEGRAATWAPIGLVIVGGLTTSTFLTVLIIPTLYSLLDDLSRFVRKVARAA